MRYIFIQEGYDPFPDPNSICTKAIVRELCERGEEVYIVCDGYKGFEDKFNPDDAIIHVPIEFEKSFANLGLFGKIRTIIKRIKILPIWPIRFPQKVKKYVSAIETVLGNEDERTVVVSVYRPAETIEAGYRIKQKHQSVKFLIYNLDGIGNNFIKAPNCFTKLMERKWAISRYNLADFIIQMKCHMEHIKESYLAFTLDKTKFADFPLVSSKSDPEYRKVDRDRNKLIYAGSFYPNLREPYYLIKLFDNICKTNNTIELICYSQGNFEEYLNDKTKENSRFIRKDYISQEKLEKVISESGAVISIGNNNSNMVPSKLFGYISTHSPIIHLVNNYEDSSLSYLKDYPLTLIVDMRDDIDINAKKVNEFLANNKIMRNSLNHQDVMKCYYMNTPQFTVELILSYVKEK